MGNGIAQVFAANGYPVILGGHRPEFLNRAIETIKKNLNRMVEKAKTTIRQCECHRS